MSDDNGLLYLGVVVVVGAIVVGASSLFSRAGQAVPSIEDIQLSIPDGMMPNQDDTVPTDNPDVGDDGVYDTDPGSGPDPDLSTSGGPTDTSPGSADADETMNVIAGGDGNDGSGTNDETLPVIDTSEDSDENLLTVGRHITSDKSKARSSETWRWRHAEENNTPSYDPGDVDDDSGVSDSSPKGYGTETIEESQQAENWIENAKEDGGANFL